MLIFTVGNRFPKCAVKSPEGATIFPCDCYSLQSNQTAQTMNPETEKKPKMPRFEEKQRRWNPDIEDENEFSLMFSSCHVPSNSLRLHQPFSFRHCSNSSIISLLPMKSGMRWCNEEGFISRMGCTPLLAIPPAR